MSCWRAVLPEYRMALQRGQIEISTTPYYHPILPLLCDTDIARVANPAHAAAAAAVPLSGGCPRTAGRARAYSTSALRPAAGGLVAVGRLGLRSGARNRHGTRLPLVRHATKASSAARGISVSGAIARGYPENGPELYTPWRLEREGKSMSGFFRDHYLSDLVGFVYSRMDAEAAADDFHRRLRAIGDREPHGRTATVSVILDGENAWEYYPGNGREFLRQFYRRIAERSRNSRAHRQRSDRGRAGSAAPRRNFPGSWINANFDVWIGHGEDVRAWELLRDAREAYENAATRAARLPSKRVPPVQFNEDGHGKRAYDAILAAEGSDWNWWYGPEHGSANDAEFDALYRKHLTEIYNALGEPAPDALAHPIKRAPERGRREPPSAYLDVKVDGRESSYFEWLGAGSYATDRRSSAMHGREYVLGDFYYGFGPKQFFLRVDPIAEAIAEMSEFQLRLTMWDSRETRITLSVNQGRLGSIVEQGGVCLLHPESMLSAAYGRIVEISLARELFDLRGRRELLLSVALWSGGLPIDVLPVEGMLAIALGEENFAWPPE